MAMYMGRKIAQEPQDLPIWDKFFNDHPVKSFIELGTGYGGMSLYFGLQCFNRGAEFHTFDNIQSSDFRMEIEQKINLAKSFHLIDIFSDEGQTLVRRLIETMPKPLAIFFDNGNKPREWRTFAKYTSVGDFLIVHDWDTEFKAGDIVDVAVERILVEESDARGPGWKAMWFVRV